MEQPWDAQLVGEVRFDRADVHVSVRGEIDAASSATLQQRLDHIIESTTGTIFVDMAGVDFIDSTGIRVLVVMHRSVHAQGRSLILRHVSAPTSRLLDLTGLREVLNVDDATE